MAWRRVGIFIMLTAMLSVPGYWLQAHPGILSLRLSAATTMWAPALAAAITLRGTGGGLSDIGWRAPRFRYIAVAGLLPFASSLPAYLLTWASGLGGFDPNRWPMALPYGLRAAGPASAAFLLLTAGFADKISRALGEEIGWRGLLVPELAKVVTPVRAALLSGAIWAIWHFPLIMFSGYHAPGVPIAAQLALFGIGVTADGVSYAWLRLASRSVWPPVLLHASFNLLTQSFFDQATVTGPWTNWIVGEFGLGVPILTIVVAVVFLPRLREIDGNSAASQINRDGEFRQSSCD